MKRVVVICAVFLLTGLLAQSSSADWADEMCKKPGACEEVGPLSPGILSAHFCGDFAA